MYDVVKKILIWAGTILVMTAIIGFLAGNKEVYIGFTLGGAIAMLNFYMISVDVEAVVRSGAKAKKTAVMKFLKRYFWAFAIITVAVKIFKFNNFIGLIAGLFLVQAVMFMQKVILRK